MSVEFDTKALGQKIDQVGEKLDSMKDFGTQIKSLQDAVAEMQTKNAHNGRYVDANGNKTVSPEMKGMIDYLANRTSTPETKTASIGNPATGGYFAVPGYISEVVPKLVNDTPLLQEIRSFSVDADITDVPVATEDPEMEWVGELQTRGETDIGVAMASIPMNEATATIPLSNALIWGSNLIGIENYVMTAIQKSISRGIGEAILYGDGNKKPAGVLSDDRIPVVKSGSAKALTVDCLYDALGALPNDVKNPKWVMSRATFYNVAKLFGTASSYVHMPLAADIKPMILGHEVIFGNAPAIASTATPIVLGDFSAGYFGVVSNGMKYIRDELTRKKQGITEMTYLTRFGGQVVQPEAFVKITVGTAGA